MKFNLIFLAVFAIICIVLTGSANARASPQLQGGGGGGGGRNCLELWQNTCTASNPCCPGLTCDNMNGGWEYGVCKH